jgi:hypothetical protein
MNELLLMRIDDPADHVLRKPTCRVRGWCAGPGWADASRLELRIEGAAVPWQAQTRPDVAAEYPESSVTGFIIDIDLSKYLYAIRSGELSLTLAFPGAPERGVGFSVAPGVAARCLAAAAGV